MSISVRYGDTGDLGSLAVQAGQGQEFWRRFQMEQQVIDSVRQRQIQEEALRLEASRLQQAAAVQRSQASRSGTQPSARSMGSPMAKKVKEDVDQKQAFLGNMFAPKPEGTGTISGGGTTFKTAGEEITGTRTYTDASGQQVTEAIPAEEIQKRGGYAGGGPPETKDPELQRKLAYIQSLNLPPDVAQSLAIQAQDLPMSSLAVRAENAMTRSDRVGGMTPAQRMSAEATATRNQATILKDAEYSLKKNASETDWKAAISPQIANTELTAEQLALRLEVQPIRAKLRELAQGALTGFGAPVSVPRAPSTGTPDGGGWSMKLVD